MRGLRLKADKVLDRLACLAFCPRLEGAAKQDQRDDDGRRLVVDVGGSRRQDTRKERRDDGITPGSRRAQHHQRIHVGGPVKQVGNALPEKAEPRSEQDGGGEHELDDEVVAHADVHHDPVMEGRDEMRPHL